MLLKLIVPTTGVDGKSYQTPIYIGEPSPKSESPIGFQKKWLGKNGINVEELDRALIAAKESSERNRISLGALCSFVTEDNAATDPKALIDDFNQATAVFDQKVVSKKATEEEIASSHAERIRNSSPKVAAQVQTNPTQTALTAPAQVANTGSLSTAAPAANVPQEGSSWLLEIQKKKAEVEAALKKNEEDAKK